jgi:hypothetical protein
MILKHIRNVRGFFSDYYLGSIFSEKLARGSQRPFSEREIDLAYSRFRRIYERASKRTQDSHSSRENFHRPLIRDILGYHLGSSEDHLHGLYASAEEEQAGKKPIIIAYCGSWNEELDPGRVKDHPVRLLEQALARLNIKYGFLITGERARIIRAPGEGSRGAYLEVDLAGLAEDEDPPSFMTFLRLFSISSFIPDSCNKFPIEEIEYQSCEHAERVSEDLKEAVFSAAGSMVSGLIADLIARGEASSPLEIDNKRLLELRDAALLALYRILFILYAEARDPRLEEHVIYKKSYSAQGLLEDILHEPGRQWPQNRCSFWDRLRALFNIYDSGLPSISSWERFPPRGSDFFSKNTPAGKILNNARLSDSEVAKLILNLATTRPRRGVGFERISFRELDIEQLGSVYEGLLEYEPRILNQTAFELNVQGRIYVLTPDDVYRLCEKKNLSLRGDRAIVSGTKVERLLVRESNPNHNEETFSENLDVDSPILEEDIESSESENTENEEEEVKKGASASLTRRLEPGTFQFVPGPARKGSGSFYTPRLLVQDLVRHALGPQIIGKKTAEIEGLRILDPACGSAHFLVEAMRFLGQALHKAYVNEYGGKPPPEFRSTTGQGWDKNWKASDEEARSSNSEARAWCKRRIAERCLYGVDLNPMAVQLARVALWIESVAGDRPLTYFEHHIRCGNSLLGSWMRRLEEPPVGIKKKNRTPGEKNQFGLFQDYVRNTLYEASRLRRIIDTVNADDLRREGIEPESTEEQRYKEDLRKIAEETLATAKLLFNIRSAADFLPEVWSEWDMLTSLISDPKRLRSYAENRPWWKAFEETCERERFFHWELEFPEVLLDGENPGFDAVVGNPPWDKILPNRHEFYGRYDILIRAFTGGELDRRIKELIDRDHTLSSKFDAYRNRINTLATILKNGGDYNFNEWLIEGKATGGHQDAFKFFVERAWQLAREGGRVGFVVPSAIYNNEGCTGLRHLLIEQSTVERFYAFENRKKIFPIHSSYKFVSLVFKKGKPEDDHFAAAFMRHEMSELEATARFREAGQENVRPFAAPWIVPVSRKELKCLSPGTLAFLEYRLPRDREILLKMYGYDSEGNPVKPRPLLGDQGPGTWNARFYTEFNMTNDRDLWTDPKTGKLYNPRQVLGSVPGTTARTPFYDPVDWPEIRARMAEKGFWPLYEGKHIEQFLIDIKPIERWVSLDACEKKYSKPPDPGPKLVFRDIASNTNERTCIAAVLPERSCANNKLPMIKLSELNLNIAATVLNSFAFDFSIRFRVSSTLNFTHVLRIAVPSMSEVYSVKWHTTLSAAGTELTSLFEDQKNRDSLWSTNRAVAEAYGLGPDDFEYILSTFPVFARKRPEFYAYLQERVREWKEELAGTRRETRVYPVSGSMEAPKAAEHGEPYSPLNEKPDQE